MSQIGPPVYCDRRPAPCYWHKAWIGPSMWGEILGRPTVNRACALSWPSSASWPRPCAAAGFETNSSSRWSGWTTCSPTSIRDTSGDLEFFQGGLLYSGKISSLEFSPCAKSKCDSGAALLKRRGETWKQRLSRGFPISRNGRNGAIRYGLYVRSVAVFRATRNGVGPISGAKN